MIDVTSNYGVHIKYKLTSRTKQSLKYYLYYFDRKLKIIEWTLNKLKCKPLVIKKTIFGIPTEKKLISVIRSPHVHKKGQDQFFFFKYKKNIHLKINIKEKKIIDSVLSLFIQASNLKLKSNDTFVKIDCDIYRL